MVLAAFFSELARAGQSWPELTRAGQSSDSDLIFDRQTVPKRYKTSKSRFPIREVIFFRFRCLHGGVHSGKFLCQFVRWLCRRLPIASMAPTVKESTAGNQ